MKRSLFLAFAFLLLCLPVFAQPSLVTVTGTIYRADGSTCGACTITISKARTPSSTLGQPARTVTADGSGNISFTAVQGSFATITGTFVRGKYNFAAGVELYFPAQSSVGFDALLSGEDALLSLLPATYAPANGSYLTVSSESSLSNETSLTGLTENVSPSSSTDFVLTFNAAGSTLRKVKLGNLPGGGGGGGGTWGSIAGTLSDQTDLQAALDAKQAAFSSQTANRVYAGPTTGSAAAPTFRALVSADLPSHSHAASDITSGTLGIARGGTGLSTIASGNLLYASALDTLAELTLGSSLGITAGTLDVASGGVTNTMLAGSIANAKLANSAITIAGTSTSLGGSITLDTITGLASTGLVKRSASNTLAIATSGTDYEVPLTFSTGLTRSTNTITVNTSQNIATLSNLTSNGFVKTSGGAGTLSVDTTSYTPTTTTVAGNALSGNISAATLTASLNAVVGDSGSGGTKGLVPAPGAGDAAAAKYLKADGTWATVSASPTFANPTASVGLSAVNGVATTAMRSDAAPALDQTIAPTWTGIHTFNNGVTTGTGSTAGTVFNYNSLTTGDGASFSSSSITTGNLLKLASTSTAGNGFSGLNIAVSGANGTSSRTVIGESITVTNTGTSSTNVGLQIQATGGTTNTPINVKDTTQSIFSVLSDGSVRFQDNPSSANGGYIGTTDSGYSTFIGNRGGGGGTSQYGALVRPSYGVATQSLYLFTSGLLGWGQSNLASQPGTGVDLWLRRNGAANLGFGAAATSATPVAQTITMQDASGTNVAGVATTLVGSLGTSQGAPGILDFKTGGLIAPSGTTAQTAVSRQILGATKVLTNNSATTVTNVTVASNTIASGLVTYTVEVFDGTDLQLETGEFVYTVTNKGGTIANNTITSATGWPKNSTTSGTLTVTWAISAANPALLSVNANSSLTPSTGYPRVTYSVRNLTQQAIAPQ